MLRRRDQGLAAPVSGILPWRQTQDSHPVSGRESGQSPTVRIRGTQPAGISPSPAVLAVVLLDTFLIRPPPMDRRCHSAYLAVGVDHRAAGTVSAMTAYRRNQRHGKER